MVNVPATNSVYHHPNRDSQSIIAAASILVDFRGPEIEKHQNVFKYLNRAPLYTTPVVSPSQSPIKAQTGKQSPQSSGGDSNLVYLYNSKMRRGVQQAQRQSNSRKFNMLAVGDEVMLVKNQRKGQHDKTNIIPGLDGRLAIVTMMPVYPKTWIHVRLKESGNVIKVRPSQIKTVVPVKSSTCTSMDLMDLTCNAESDEEGKCNEVNGRQRIRRKQLNMNDNENGQMEGNLP